MVTDQAIVFSDVELNKKVSDLENDKVALTNKLQTLEQRLQKFEKMLAQLQIETNNTNREIVLSSQSGKSVR